MVAGTFAALLELPCQTYLAAQMSTNGPIKRLTNIWSEDRTSGSRQVQLEQGMHTIECVPESRPRATAELLVAP
jgi:hypothetical protein